MDDTIQQVTDIICHVEHLCRLFLCNSEQNDENIDTDVLWLFQMSHWLLVLSLVVCAATSQAASKLLPLTILHHDMCCHLTCSK